MSKLNSKDQIIHDIYFDTDEGTRAMGQIGKTADDTTKGRTVEELYEAEEIYGPYGKEEQEGIAGGISNLEKFVKKKYAAGGRVGFISGKFVKDGIAALLKLNIQFLPTVVLPASIVPLCSIQLLPTVVWWLTKQYVSIKQ